MVIRPSDPLRYFESADSPFESPQSYRLNLLIHARRNSRRPGIPVMHIAWRPSIAARSSSWQIDPNCYISGSSRVDFLRPAVWYSFSRSLLNNLENSNVRLPAKTGFVSTESLRTVNSQRQVSARYSRLRYAYQHRHEYPNIGSYLKLNVTER